MKFFTEIMVVLRSMNATKRKKILILGMEKKKDICSVGGINMEELGDFEEFEFDTIEDEALVELNQVEDLRLLIIVFSYF